MTDIWRLILKFSLVLLMVLFLAYLVLPTPQFPSPPPDALQSNEPADTETPLRRAYFTNYTRQEVLEHYQKQLSKSSFLNLPPPTYRLNYPPEEANTIIRDQTRSTFLEEIVHPFRESLFVNGFEPKEEKDAIFIGGKNWRQKITVRFVPSLLLPRLIILSSAVILAGVIFREWVDVFLGFMERARK